MEEVTLPSGTTATIEKMPSFAKEGSKPLSKIEREFIDLDTGFIPTKDKHASLQDEETGAYYDVLVKRINHRKRVATVEPLDDKYVSESFRVPLSSLEPPINPDINTRFAYYENVVRLTLNQKIKALIVSGKGGIGKTYTVEQVMESLELEEDEDYAVVKGNCTPKALFNIISEYKDKTIFFDDCDSILKHSVSGNVLKATLDAFAKKRVVSWLTSASSAGAPQRVEFTGQIIFISNLNIGDIEQALISRCVVIDLHMTSEEKLERMQNLLGKVLPELEIPMYERQAVLDMLKKFQYTVKDLNVRTLLKALTAWHNSHDWGFVKYQITNG